MMEWLTGQAATLSTPPSIEVGGRDLPIIVKRHRTAKRLILRLAPDGSEVHVTMPRWGQSRDAVEFAQSRHAWIARQLGSVDAIDPPAHGKSVPYRGEMKRIVWDPAAPRTLCLAGDTVTIGGPEENITRRLERWLRSRAQELMEEDLDHYCTIAGIATPDLRLSRAQRRWGSCSSGGTVRINWRLIMAPDYIRRSVVAHEAAHLEHFDHSAAFHALLGTLFEGDIQAANNWLKTHGRSLYRYFD